MAPLYLLVASLALVRHVYAGDAAVYDSQFSRITNDEWDEIFSTPNATGEVTFSGYNTTAPFPGSPLDGWRLSVKVKEGLPSSFDGMVTTATEVSWGAPKELMVKNTTNNTYGLAPIHPSWEIHQIFMSAGEFLSEDDDVEIDGSCKGFLSDDCVDEYHKQLADTYNRGGNAIGSNRYANVTPPSACKPPLRIYEAFSMHLPHDKLNRTKEEDGLFKYAKLSAGIMSRHEPGNMTDYDKSIRRVYMMMFVWGYNNVTQLTLAPGTKPNTTIVCAKANVVEGSRTLEDAKDNQNFQDWVSRIPGNEGAGSGNGNGNGNGNGGTDPDGNGNTPDEPSSAVRIGSLTGLWLVIVGAGFVLML